MLRKLRIWFGIVAVNLIFLEIGSYAFLKWAEHIGPHYFEGYWEHFINSVDSRHVEEFREKAYDAELGWTIKPNARIDYENSAGVAITETYDGVGSRTNPLYPGTIAASSYGGSTTLGAEVHDDETWQYHLSKLLRANVQNFGVGGYGPDQGLLKLERHLNSGTFPPIVILSTTEENIGRIVNTFRPFYYRSTILELGFKPRFDVSQDGEFRLIPNPLSKFEDGDDHFAALSRAKTTDYWFQHSERRIEVAFPFIWRAIDLFFRVGERKGFLKRPFRHVQAEQHSLWEGSYGPQIMSGIVDRFFRLSQQFGFHPILLFLPSVKEGDDGSLSIRAKYLDFVAATRERYKGKDLSVIDFSEAEVDLERFRVRRHGGHYSAYGNRVIAEFIYERIRRLPIILGDRTLSDR